MKKTSHIALLMIWLVLTMPFAFAQEVAGNNTTSAVSTSTTIEIRNINLVFENERTIFTWATNVPTTSVVDIGRTISLGNTTTDAALVTNHSVTVPTISGTEYFYRFTSCDASGGCKVSPTQNFFAGKMFVTADVARYSRGKTIDIAGRTRPGASVTVFLNGASTRRLTTQRGDFLIREIEIGTVGTTNLTFFSSLGAENATFSAVTEVDSSPASLNVSLTPTATTQPLIVNMTASEPVNLTITVKPQGEAPLRPGELQASDIQAAKISLKWSQVSNILEYALYRDGKRLATIGTNEYIDSGVSAGKTYQYQVSAVAKNCVEGDKSDLTTAATPNGTARPDTFVPVKFSCASDPQQLFLKEGRSSASVPLREGENVIEFKAIDKAGYTTLVEERVVYDTGPPRFLSTNLRQLSPTYQQSVTVNGKLSEPGSVTAFVNGKAAKTVLTAPDGTFAILVKLERSASLQANATRVIGQIVWANKIKLQAADAVGLTAQTPDEQIDFQLCGTGTKVQVELSTPTPQILNPRLLMQGVQTIGMSFKYKYAGGQTANIDKNQIKVTPVALSPEVSKQYDNGLVRYTNKPLGVRSVQRGVKNEGQGYVQFTFNGIDNPWEQLPELKDAKQPANATTQAKLEAIANHRSGKTQFTSDVTALPQTSDCLIPGFGCMKLFFELEIPFQETVGPLSTDPLVRQTSETSKTTPQIQRSCLAVEVPIDIPIPPRYIPKGLLQATAEILTAIIEGIDKVLKPIETIGKYLFYSCLAGQAISLVPIFLEKYNCEFSSVFSSATNEGKFKTEFATIGACDEQYSGENEDQSRSNCNSCQSAKERRAEVDFLYRRLCDRVMCPSAPSLQYYLKQNANQQLTPVPEPIKDMVIQKFAGSKSFSDSKGRLYAGSDCAAWVKSKQKGPSIQRTRDPPRVFFSYAEVKEIYTDWIKHQSDDGDEQTSSSTVNCDGLHPASPECCGYQYMEEWSSACGLGTFNFLDTFDEIKESTCLSAEKSGQSSIKLDAVGQTPAKELECGSVINSIGGFCDPQGGAPPEPLPIVKLCCDSASGATGRLLAASASKEQKLFLFLLPRNAQTIAPQGATTGEYDIAVGEVVEAVEYDRRPADQRANAADLIPITSSLRGVRRQNAAISALFDSKTIDLYNQNPNSAELRGTYDTLKTQLCLEAGYTNPADAACTVDGREVYDRVMAIMGTPDQEYIIRPGDGLVNSLRCVCVPTLIAFLKRWRGILGAVRDCMNTILLTGDGSAGVCQAVVSQHACDLLYDAIACFTQKFSKPSGARGTGSGIGNVMGALTSTGQELSRSAQSRYGESPIYKQVFVDKKLVHSICLFAFTGTWNLDVDAIFDAAVNEIPTKSYGLIFPCSRRFVAFNPATRPAGLVSWQYEFGAGLAAGSAVENIELVLKCSGGFKCRESDGFLRGKCDCETPKEITINPENMPTQAKNGEIVNEQLFTIIEGAPGEGQIRYDKAYLRWNWNDGKQTRQDKTEECTISTDGGPGNVPSECRFDPLSLAFRCSLGESGDGIQFLEAIARPSLNIPTPVFAVEQQVDAELKVRQTLIDATGVKGGKHIQYSIKTAGGREVAKNDQLLLVTKSGDYTVNVKNDFGVSPRVSPTWFGSGGTGTSPSKDIKMWSNKRNEQTVSPASELLASLEITDSAGKAREGQYHFIVEITLDGTRELYKLYSARSAQTDVDRVSGLKTIGSELPGGSEVLGREIIYAGSSAASTATDRTDTQPKIKLTLTRAPLGLIQGEKRQLLVSYGLPTVTNACDSETGRKTPQPFTLTYTSYDSAEFGGPSEQISIDPATEEPVVKTVQFNAICAREGDPALASIATSTQTATLADKLRRIQQVLEPLLASKREGERALREIAGATESKTDGTTITADQILQNKNKLLRTLEEVTATHQRVRDEFQPALKAFQDEFASIKTTDPSKAKATEVKTALEQYNARLGQFIDAFAPLPERARALPSEREGVYQLTSRAISIITPFDTEPIIQQTGGIVGIAERIYQLFTGKDAFRYDETANAILYRDPTTAATKKWTYFGGEGIFRTDPGTKTSDLINKQTYSILLFHSDNMYELFYEKDIVPEQVSREVLVSAKIYQTDGRPVGTGNGIVSADMPIVVTLNRERQDRTRTQLLPLINTARGGTTATCVSDATKTRKCDFTCEAPFETNARLTCAEAKQCCENDVPAAPTAPPIAPAIQLSNLKTALTTEQTALLSAKQFFSTESTKDNRELEKYQVNPALIDNSHKPAETITRLRLAVTTNLAARVDGTSRVPAIVTQMPSRLDTYKREIETNRAKLVPGASFTVIKDALDQIGLYTGFAHLDTAQMVTALEVAQGITPGGLSLDTSKTTGIKFTATDGSIKSFEHLDTTTTDAGSRPIPGKYFRTATTGGTFSLFDVITYDRIRQEYYIATVTGRVSAADTTPINSISVYRKNGELISRFESNPSGADYDRGRREPYLTDRALTYRTFVEKLNDGTAVLLEARQRNTTP